MCAAVRITLSSAFGIRLAIVGSEIARAKTALRRRNGTCTVALGIAFQAPRLLDAAPVTYASELQSRKMTTLFWVVGVGGSRAWLLGRSEGAPIPRILPAPSRRVSSRPFWDSIVQYEVEGEEGFTRLRGLPCLELLGFLRWRSHQSVMQVFSQVLMHMMRLQRSRACV